MVMTHSTTIAAMTEDEYIAHFAESIQSYAKEKVASGQWSAEEASARAQAETDALLTDGFATPGHWFYTLRDGDGAKVGSICAADGTIVRIGLSDKGKNAATRSTTADQNPTKASRPPAHHRRRRSA